MQKNKLSDFDKSVHDDGLIIWYEKESDEIVCLVSLKPRQGQTWICGLYVAPKYRGLGICRGLLDYATFNGGNHLSVRKSSHAAEIYKNYGFTTYDEDDKALYMSINVHPEADAALKDAHKPGKELPQMSELKPRPCPICGAELKIYGPEDWRPTFNDPDSGGEPYNAVCDCGFQYSNRSYDYTEFIACLNRRAKPANEPLTLEDGFDITNADGTPVDYDVLGMKYKDQLCYCDIDGFYVGEDGGLVLMDDCGKAVSVDRSDYHIEVHKPGGEQDA